MNLDLEKSLIVAVCNVDKGRTAHEVSEILNRPKASVQSKLGKMKNHGYVVSTEEEADEGHNVQRYIIKPKAYNEATEVLERYYRLVTLGIGGLEDGFNGHKIGRP